MVIPLFQNLSVKQNFKTFDQLSDSIISTHPVPEAARKPGKWVHLQFQNSLPQIGTQMIGHVSGKSEKLGNICCFYFTLREIGS